MHARCEQLQPNSAPAKGKEDSARYALAGDGKALGAVARVVTHSAGESLHSVTSQAVPNTVSTCALVRRNRQRPVAFPAPQSHGGMPRHRTEDNGVERTPIENPRNRLLAEGDVRANTSLTLAGSALYR